MVVELYGSLATTAGVFVGLLTAYLVSRIVELKAERRRIERRADTINARINALKPRHEWRDEQLSQMERWESQQEADNIIDNFLYYQVGDDWNPDADNINSDQVIQALIQYEYIDLDDVSQSHRDIISERLDEIKEELRPAQGLVSHLNPTDPTISVPPDIQVTSVWDTHRESLQERRTEDYVEVDTEIRSLKKEREQLLSHYEESDPSELIKVLRSTAWILVLSIVIPLLVYLLNVTGITLSMVFGDVIEPFLVFVSWCLGLGLTYRHIRHDILTTEGSFPDPVLDDDPSTQEGSAENGTEDESDGADQVDEETVETETS